LWVNLVVEEGASAATISILFFPPDKEIADP
jgi:hypothetical protein